MFGQSEGGMPLFCESFGRKPGWRFPVRSTCSDQTACPVSDLEILISATSESDKQVIVQGMLPSSYDDSLTVDPFRVQWRVLGDFLLSPHLVFDPVRGGLPRRRRGGDLSIVKHIHFEKWPSTANGFLILSAKTSSEIVVFERNCLNTQWQINVFL